MAPACNGNKKGETGDGAKAPTAAKPKSGVEAGLPKTAQAIITKIAALEVEKDVTCWTSFRQLDSFIAAKSYSDFATLAKIVAAKALAHHVWVFASRKAAGDEVGAADIDAAIELPEVDVPTARKQEVEAFATELGMQQFKDYRTTSEHLRVLLSVAQDEVRRAQPAVKPLNAEGIDRLALVVTKLSLALLNESGTIATEARSPLIEADHVKQAYAALKKRYGLGDDAPTGELGDAAAAKKALVPLTGALIDAKIEALRSYNRSSDDIGVELNRISKTPLEPDAVARITGELKSFARFAAKGYEPMRADNYLADGNFAPAKIEGKSYVDAADVENVTMQVFPYLMMPNGDCKLRFVPRPGTISKRDLKPQDVALLDHHMNAVRDTAIHWTILKEVWRDDPYAMDPFGAEYLSEVVSIMATFYLRRAQTLASQQGKPKIDGAIAAQIRDNGYVMVLPETEQRSAWGPEQEEAKTKALASYGGPLFEDTTAAAGLPTEVTLSENDTAPGESGFDIQAVMGAGIAVGDIDGDRDPDLFVAGDGLGRLYLNDGKAKFTDATEAWKIPGPLPDSRGALMVDFDGDDDLDLLVLRSRNPSLLLENTDGVLKDVASERGVATQNGAHVASWFDYDQDGDLDLYVGYYGSEACNKGQCQGRNLPSIDGRNGTQNQLFRQDDGKFTEVGVAAGVADGGWTLATGTFDYDRDGDLDLYLANDFGRNPLFENKGDGTFVDVAETVGAADRGSGMNVSFADVDADGTFDVFVSNIDMFSKSIKVVFPTDESILNLNDSILRSFQYLSGNKLYVNRDGDGGGRRFEAVESVMFEPGDRGWGWAGLFFDFENDGDEDVYLTNGWIPRSPAADQKNQMFIRDGELFYKATESSPEAFAANSRAAVATDLDGDGKVDLVVGNYRGAPRVLRNRWRKPGEFMALRLRGLPGNTRAVGAVATITAGERIMRRQITCGIGYLGQAGDVVHVGLGEAKEADVHIRWPDGTQKTYKGLAAGKIHELDVAAGIAQN